MHHDAHILNNHLDALDQYRVSIAIIYDFCAKEKHSDFKTMKRMIKFKHIFKYIIGLYPMSKQ